MFCNIRRGGGTSRYPFRHRWDLVRGSNSLASHRKFHVWSFTASLRHRARARPYLRMRSEADARAQGTAFAFAHSVRVPVRFLRVLCRCGESQPTWQDLRLIVRRLGSNLTRSAGGNRIQGWNTLWSVHVRVDIVMVTSWVSPSRGRFKHYEPRLAVCIDSHDKHHRTLVICPVTCQQPRVILKVAALPTSVKAHVLASLGVLVFTPPPAFTFVV